MSPADVTHIRGALAATLRAGSMIAVVTTLGILVAACGSSNSPAAASVTPSPTPTPTEKAISKVDACTLVTAAEATAVAGTPVASLGGASGVQVPGACIYGSSDGTTTVLVFAQVYPDSSSAASVSPEQMAAALNGAYGVANAKVVSGIGTKAVEYSLTSSGSSGLVIFVFKSNVVMMIAVTPTANSTALEQLAKTAVGRL